MTAATLQRPRRDRMRLSASVSRMPLAGVGMLIGGALIYLGYTMATSTLATGRAIIWLGVAITVLAFLAGVSARDVKYRGALGLCCLLGAVLFLMKLGREPNVFVFNDELQHVRSTVELLRGARLFVPNPINPLVAHYPGLHLATAVLARSAGVSVFVAGNVLVLAARVLLMAGLFALFAELLQSPRLAALAVLVYASNPSFTYFDAQFSYESLALPLAVAALALAMGRRASSSPAVSLPVTFALIAAVIVTHHITSYALALLLLLFGGARLSERGWRRTWPLLIAAAATSIGAAAWAVFVAPDTWAYLTPGIRHVLNLVPSFFTGHAQVRTPFAKSPLHTPIYEVAFGYLSVPLVLLAASTGVFIARRRRLLTPTLVICVLVGVVYFASLPLQLLGGPTATPIAPRLWETSFLGLAPLAAIGLDWCMRHARRLAWWVGALGACVLVIGGAIIRSGPNIRLPGPYLPSSGPLAATPDTLTAARWFLRHYGPGQRIMADATLAPVFGAYSLAIPETYQNFGIKVWRVFLSPTMTAAGLHELERSRTRFVVVDRRLSDAPPFTGYFFNPSEPREPFRTVPLLDLLKFGRLRDFRTVYVGPHVSIFQFLPGRPPTLRGGFRLHAGRRSPSRYAGRSAGCRRSGIVKAGTGPTGRGRLSHVACRTTGTARRRAGSAP